MGVAVSVFLNSDNDAPTSQLQIEQQINELIFPNGKSKGEISDNLEEDLLDLLKKNTDNSLKEHAINKLEEKNITIDSQVDLKFIGRDEADKRKEIVTRIINNINNLQK